MLKILQREGIYLWYYFDVQFRQIFGYWALGIIIGSVISVFAKDKIHGLFAKMNEKNWGVRGILPASLLGIASPLCMYGTIPIAASFANIHISFIGTNHSFHLESLRRLSAMIPIPIWFCGC